MSAQGTFFLELKPEVKVTVNPKQCATLWDPKLYPQTKFGIFTSNNTCCGHNLSRTAARGQGHSDPLAERICDTSQPQDVSTDKIWDSYLK